MTDVHDPAPLDTAQLRSWARWCPGQTNLMCLNHLLHRAADEIDRLRAEHDDALDCVGDAHMERDEWKARLAAVEALCDTPHAFQASPPVVRARVRAATRGETPHA